MKLYTHYPAQVRAAAFVQRLGARAHGQAGNQVAPSATLRTRRARP